MSLILKQEPANTIPTPPAGKSTLFVNDNSVMSVKSPDGNVTTFPTVQGSNTQVFFNDNGAINGNANLVFNKTSATMTVTNLSVTGNLNAGDINVSSIANGTSNVDIIGASGNVTTSVAGTANVLVVTATGAIITGTFSASGNANVGNLGTTGVFATTLSASGNANVGNLGTTGVFATTLSASGNANVGNLGVSGTITTTTISGDLLTGAQPNITSTGTLTSLSVTGTATAGNLATAGTLSAGGNANVGNLGTALITATGNVTGANIITAGIVSATGNVSGQFFIGNGSQLTGIDATAIQNGNSNVRVFPNTVVTASVAGNANIFAVLGTGIQANGTVSASGNVTAGNVDTGGLITATGNVTGSNLITAGSVFAPAIVANGGAFATQIALSTSTGIIEANTGGNATQFLSSGTLRLPVTGTSQIVGNTSDGSIVQLTADAHLKQVRGGNVVLQVGTGGNVASTLSFNNNGSLSAPGAVSAVGNVTGGNITTGGLVTSTGNVTGGNITTGGLVTATGNVSGGNLTTGGLVSATGNIVSAANVVTDLIAGRTTSVTITAAGTNQNINLTPTGSGTVNVGNFIISNVATPVNSTDAATKQYVDDVAQGLNIHDSCNAATTTTLATISGGTVTYNNGTAGVGATLTTTGTYTTIDGVTLSNGMRILVKDEVTTANNGIYVRTSATVLTRAADFNTPAEMEGGDFTFITAGTLYDNTGWVQVSTVVTVGTDPIEWTQFSGAGTYSAGTGLTLTGSQFNISNTTVTAGAYGNGDYNATFTVNGQGQLSAAANVAITANAGNLSGTVLKSTVVTSSLTSVGTLTTLSISGNANIGNVGAAAGVFTTVSGNGSALTAITGANVSGAVAFATTANAVAGANVSGQVGNALVAGTVYTGAQGNITSLGTLSSLSVSGNANVGNIGATNLVGTLTTASQTNITAVGTLAGLSVSGNANVGNIGAGAGIYTTLSASGNVTGGNLVSTGQLGGTGATHLGNTFTTGANTTVGTVTGNFALSAGSRFQATYA